MLTSHDVMATNATVMDEKSSGCSPLPKRARFFCTAGRGMERFVTEEIACKLSATDIETTSGKVFFSAEPDICRLKKLKSAERLFLLLKKGSPLSLPKNKGHAISTLRKCLIEEQPQVWLDTLDLWHKLQEPIHTQTDLCGDFVEFSQKRKLEMDSDFHISKKCKQKQTAEDRACKLQNQPQKEPMKEAKDHDVLKDGEKNIISKQLPANTQSNPVTFRVSCRCTGANGKIFTTQEVGQVIGVSLIKHFGWKSDLRRPVLEVFVHLSDNYSVVGYPVMRHPLASREYIQRTGLRSTVAWAMTSIAEIRAGFVVLDPMCGVGTILLEAAKQWPDVRFLGVDINDAQLESAIYNIKEAGLTDSVEFLNGSALGLPIRSESIDVLVSDIPFGRKFTTSKNMKELLPDLLREMERVLHVEGIIVLLLSQSLHHHLKTNFQFKDSQSNVCAVDDSLHIKSENAANKDIMDSKNNLFQSLAHIESHAVSLGVTEAVIFKCKKTSTSLAI
ncbi:U6 snRNA (guanine-N(2))-methyltransferase THUMPD2 [Discoglossus pictus]